MAGSRYSLIPKSFWQYLGPAYRGLDADVAALEAAAGSSNIAAELLGSRWVFDGDSITSFGSGLEALRLLSLKSNGRIIGVAETAVPGRSTTQALIDFDIKIAPLAGSVDVIYYEEMTHSISNGLTVIQFLAQLDQYNAKVKAMGARLVVASGYPNSSVASTIATWNRALINWGRINAVPVVPFYRLADPATGNYPSGWSADGIHPNSSGASIQAFADLALDYLDPLLGPADISEAMFQGDGLFTNNFFTSLRTASTGSVTEATPSATTGTLAAGIYSYVFSCWDWSGPGHNATKKTVSYTLPDVGGINFALAWSGSLAKIVVYRKGPADSSYYLVAAVDPAGSWTDNGMPAQPFIWQDVDFAQYPVGVAFYGGIIPRPTESGPFVFTEAGIRGNVFRSVAYYDQIDLGSSLTPGSQVDVAFKIRVNYPSGTDLPFNATPSAVVLRWSGGSGGQNLYVPAGVDLSGNWFTFYQRFTVPGTQTALVMTIQPPDISSGVHPELAGCTVDIAEVLCAHV